ncbi:hypothetical protein [Aneurinibacillus aneurinilyticus]|uniref:hypothetical protein n=1 Tax=Aneurinibacillus aneurinilyticus TaxID=1391 RepID=UPI0023F2CD3B|nr:hypothetical protein [Aneurinibacillus aneurinilyticus]
MEYILEDGVVYSIERIGNSVIKAIAPHMIYDEESGEFVPAPPPEPVPQVPDPIEQLQAENAALMMQVAQLEAKNEQQAGDTAFLILKNAELEAQATQTAQEQASLLMELTMKGVL